MKFTLFSLKNPERLVLDLETDELSTALTELGAKVAADDPYVQALRVAHNRPGVIRVVEEFRHAARLDERGFERVFASGGGSPAVLGRDAGGHLMVPAVPLHFLVKGMRSQVADARQRLIDYLVESFEEFVFV